MRAFFCILPRGLVLFRVPPIWWRLKYNLLSNIVRCCAPNGVELLVSGGVNRELRALESGCETG